jgi:uroporphyrinogen-III decarboxylase
MELVKELNEHFNNQKRLNPNSVAMTGIYVTLISGLLEVFGWDHLLVAAGMDAQGFGETTNRYAQFIQPYFNALADCDSEVIMVHDDIVWTSGAFIHPDWYRKYIFPNYKTMFKPLVEAGKKIIYTSDGNYTAFIDDIAKCQINGFVMEPTTDMQYIADHYGKTHSFIGNADTRILLSGTKDQIYHEVKRCMDIGKKYPGFFMAVGNHIPANTPIENALYYNEIYEELSRR